MAEKNASVQEEKWDIIIKPKDKLLTFDLKELWAYRDLCGLFVKRNIITQYKQTILGPVWFIVQPALTVIMYMIVSAVSPAFRRMVSRGRCSTWRVLVHGPISRVAWARRPIRLSPIPAFSAKCISRE